MSHLYHTISRLYDITWVYPYAQVFFEFFEIFLEGGGIFYEYFSLLLTWNSMGGKISKRYSSYKSQLIFLNFLPNGPHLITVGIFEISKIDILTNFIRFRSSQQSSQNHVWDFWNFEFVIFNEIW